MPIMGPKGSGFNKGRFVNAPYDIEDAKGGAGLGSTKHGAHGLSKNNLGVKAPNRGDNSAFMKHGKKMKAY